MTTSVTLKRWTIAVSCLLLPLSLAAESRLVDGQRATAHLMFKIVIPQELSLDLGQTLAIGGKLERHQMVLAGSGHHSVAHFMACTRAEVRDNAPLNCTVSMP